MSTGPGSMGDFSGGGLATSNPVHPTAEWKEVNSAYVGTLVERNNWQSLVGAAFTAYGLIMQQQSISRQATVAEQAQALARQYYDLALNNFNTIALPTFNRLKDLFDESLNCFRAKQCEYLDEAMRLKTYVPDYITQMGRRLGIVSQMYDNAAKQRSRALGPYASGMCCENTTRFALSKAGAMASAASQGYRYEDAKKVAMDKWYFDRWTQGASFMTAWRGHIIGGLTGGVGVTNSGLGAIGNAVNGNTSASSAYGTALGKGGDFYSNLAGLGISQMGFNQGAAAVNNGGFNGTSMFGGGGVQGVGSYGQMMGMGGGDEGYTNYYASGDTY